MDPHVVEEQHHGHFILVRVSRAADMWMVESRVGGTPEATVTIGVYRARSVAGALAWGLAFARDFIAGEPSRNSV